MNTYNQLGTRGVALTGEAALAWFARGECSVVPKEMPLRLFADYSHVHGFLVTRLWHTPLRMTPFTSPPSDERLTVIVPVSGARTMTTRHGQFKIAPNQLVLSRRAQMLALENEVPASMISLSTVNERIPGIRDLNSLMDIPLTANSGLVSVLVSAVNTTLGAPLSPESTAFAPWRRGLEYLLTAVIDSARDENSGQYDRPTTHITARALQVIDERAHDPTFSVAALCEELHVSSTSLHRAFQASDTTPGVYLRRVRTALAVDSLRSMGPTITETMLRTVAPSVGFRTARTLRRALQIDDEGRRLIRQRHL